MKKTIIININGIIFNIDEDAYNKLEAYLDKLKHYFSSNAEGSEIIADIEGRIVELFQPKITVAKQSISIDDVNEMVEILGTPEDIADAGDEPISEANARPKDNAQKGRSRLYRDPDHAIIGGVCSGLGAYFKIDPVFFRIVFIGLIFAGGISLIIYPLLWIAVPQAITAAQKLEMHGENVTVENIERAFKEEFQQVKGNLHRMNPNSAWNKIRNFINELSLLFVKLFLVLWSIFKYCLGVFLILMSVTIIIGIISTFYFNTFFVHDLFIDNFSSLQDYLHHLIKPASADLLMALGIIVAIIPLAGLIYAGLKLIIRFKSNDKWVLLSFSLMWIFSVVVFVSLIFNEVDRFKKKGTTKEEVALIQPKNNILYLNTIVTPDLDNDVFDRLANSDMFGMSTSATNKTLFGIIRINIEKSTTGRPELEIEKEAHSSTSEDAVATTKSIKVSYNQNDSALNIDPVFRVNNEQLWKFRRVVFTLKIPVGMKVYLSANVERLLNNIDNNSDYWQHDMINRTWQMTENGLELVSFTDNNISSLNIPEKRIINIQVKDNYAISKDHLERLKKEPQFGRIIIDGKKVNYGVIEFDVRQSDDNKFKVEVLKSSAGASNAEANLLVKNIQYTFEQNDTILWLDPIFRFSEKDKWNDQKVKVILRMPINSKAYLSKNLEPLIPDLANSLHRWAGELVNKTWEMSNNELSEVNE